MVNKQEEDKMYTRIAIAFFVGFMFAAIFMMVILHLNLDKGNTFMFQKDCAEWKEEVAIKEIIFYAYESSEDCWYSLNGGATNTSTSCGENMTIQSLPGPLNWMVCEGEGCIIQEGYA